MLRATIYGLESLNDVVSLQIIWHLLTPRSRVLMARANLNLLSGSAKIGTSEDIAECSEA